MLLGTKFVLYYCCPRGQNRGVQSVRNTGIGMAVPDTTAFDPTLDSHQRRGEMV